jgi:4-hydroxy-tetrahydrodipicolinate synthase
LWGTGLIDSPEVWLPMTGISEALAIRIDWEIELRNYADVL